MSNYQETLCEGPPWATPAYEREYDVEAERRRDEERYDLAHEQEPTRPNLTLADLRREQAAAKAAERSVMPTSTPTMSAAEAAEARAKLRAFTAAQKAARAARRERREERATEIAAHKEAEAKAQAVIDERSAGIEATNADVLAYHMQIREIRAKLAESMTTLAEHKAAREKAYIDRAAARGSLGQLAAEIRGDNGDGAEEVDHD